MPAELLAISPAKILKDLDALWVSLSHDHDPAETDAVLRACSMTLIVATEGESDDVGETLGQLVRDHPSRLIVLRVLPDSAPKLDAKVLAQCWMPFGRRQQICCEQIEISATNETLGDIPSVLRSLIVPDLPVVFWIRSRALLTRSEFCPVRDLADKLIVDSLGVPEAEAQIELIQGAKSERRLMADLAWTRLTRWREAIAQLFDDPATLQNLESLRSVRIDYQGAFIPMSAYYIAAWLKHSFPGKLEFEFDRVGPSEKARVQTVMLTGENLCFWVSVGQDRAVEVHSSVRDSHTVFQPLSEYELLREELSVLGPDPVYEAVIRIVPEFTKSVSNEHS